MCFCSLFRAPSNVMALLRSLVGGGVLSLFRMFHRYIGFSERRSFLHVRMTAYEHTHAHSHAHTLTHALSHTHTHTHTQTHTHKHTHKQKQTHKHNHSYTNIQEYTNPYTKFNIYQKQKAQCREKVYISGTSVS